MLKYKILIIDDDYENREKTYKKFFEYDWEDCNKCPCFDISHLDTPANMAEKIKKTDADAILIDASLKNPDNIYWRNTDISKVLDKIKAVYINTIPPIFVVSGIWNDDLLSTVNDAFADSLPNVLPQKYYTFSFMKRIIDIADIKDLETGETNCIDIIKERHKIHKIIAKHYGRTDKTLKSSNINILHISDLQYGDSKTTDNYIGIFENMIKSFKENGIENIDLIVISGDIAMSGKEYEYEKAKKVTSLLKKLWPEENSYYSDRIILAPGNHDFDINFCLLNYFAAKNLPHKREIDLLKLIKDLLSDKEIKSFPYNKYGTSAFKQFAYEITHNPVYINDNMNFVINDFLDWGIRFIVLDSISNITIKETNRVELFKEEINDIVQEINDSKYGNRIFNIVVSHHTELFLEEDDAKKDLIQVFNQLKNSINCKLFLGGHRHINDNKDGRTSNDEKYTIIEAGTLRIDEKDIKHQRGFNVLQLVNNGENINKLIEKQFVFNKDDGAIRLEKNIEHEFDVI